MNRTRYFWLAFFLIVPALVYFHYQAVSLVGHDGDSYLLEAYQNGLSYSGGYVVYLWTGKLFLFLTNNSLNTMNVVSYVFSLLCLLALYVFFYKIGVSAEAAILSVLVVAFTPMFWLHATYSAVYNFNALFTVAVLIAFFQWAQEHPTSSLILASFLYGISLGVWFGNILMLVPILIFVGIESIGQRQFGRLFGASVLCIAAGAIGPLLYIYFRSQELPPIGALYNPDTFQGFVRYMLGTQYDSLYLPAPSFLIRRGIFHASLFLCSFAGIGLSFSLAGSFVEGRLKRSYCFFLGLLLVVNFLYFTQAQTWNFYTKSTLSYMIVALFLGIGLDSSLRKSNPLMKRGLFLLFSVVILFQLTVFPAMFAIRKHGTEILQESKSTLNVLPEGATLFAFWPEYTSLLCVQTILKFRQDIDIYEWRLDARHYKKRTRFTISSALDYIDAHISNSTPIYSTLKAPELENKYKLLEVRKGLYRISR